MLEKLRIRFESNPHRHHGINWKDVEQSLLKDENSLNIITKMEETGGEVDVIAQEGGYFIFADCSKESPSQRRSLCYDKEARTTRKANAPTSSVEEMLVEIGSTLMDEKMYCYLQSLEDFDLKTSSWIDTPKQIRALKGALFGDKRYQRCFIYHNGADSYYSARGFRSYHKVKQR